MWSFCKRRNMNWRLTVGLSSVLLFAMCTTALGQEPVPSPLPSPSASPAEASETSRPLYGYQGVMVETLDGKIVSNQAENDQFNPASTLKLATALIALQTL